ncbi:matrixin family metalloprotease [Pseudarthrobacter sp. DSP2-3-2b1]|uniref:matrixin family metalloprotease n=1 Tax=Pseudarthrobacter sp. DSP2-3-2b1 TaxID=2804661 RepID=UPI003CECFD91
MLTAIGASAFLVAGFLYGDPRIMGLLDVRIGPGLQPGQPGAGQPAGGQSGTGESGTPEPGTAGRAGRSAEAPPPGMEEEGAPLGSPESPVLGSDSYGFLAVNGDGTPVGYSPCRPLHYVVNAELAPAGAQQLVPDAIDTISRATGIQFIYDGATTEQPSGQRDPYQPDAYGDRWAPLLIAWTTPEVAPQLKGKVIGTGGSTHYSFDDGPKTFVTGSLELDALQITEDLRQPDGKLYATAVILHELSHVMGLEHVDDPRQLMYPEIGSPEGLAAGDLNGLYELSKAQCRKDL